jgi:hypothetical protein
MMKKEAIIFVRFLTTEEGGRQSSIEGDRYGCPLMIDDTQGFDCRFILEGVSVFELGKEYEIAVKFLNPENALSHLSEGDEISLWEGNKIGVGTVKKFLLTLKIK